MRRFKITIMDREFQKLVDWRNWAVDHGLKSDYVATLKELDYRLAFEADDWGESREYYAELELQMRWAACRMIDVTFGVNMAMNEVFVKRFRLNLSYKPPPLAD